MLDECEPWSGYPVPANLPHNACAQLEAIRYLLGSVMLWGRGPKPKAFAQIPWELPNTARMGDLPRT